MDVAWREGRVDIQSWSILTLPLRLRGGAMGLSFLPTRSLPGSSMEEANRPDLAVADDPFGESPRVALVTSSRP